MKIGNRKIEISRRNFLQFTAGASLGTAASGITLKGLSTLSHALSEEKRPPRGPERWVTTTCQMCPGGCGLLVRCVGKRAVKIVGNPLHPVNRGGVCPKGQAALQLLYHPDRIRQPLLQTKRGSSRWQPISWEEALKLVSEKLQAVRAEGRGQGLAVLGQARATAMRDLWQRFLEAYGSPNYLSLPGRTDGPGAAAYCMQGIQAPLAYDLKNASYVLSFGTNFLEGWGSPVYVMRAFGAWRATVGQRSKLVHVSPRLSVTAAKADEWVPIRVGTEAALALGIAHVLISEGRVDNNFIAEHTFGFDDWVEHSGSRHTGFRTLVLREYRPNDVAELTGVPVETILRLAREFAANPPALALGDQPGTVQPGTLYGSMAVQSLNALVGNFERPGGVMLQSENPRGVGSSRVLNSSSDAQAGQHLALDGARFPWSRDVLETLSEAALTSKPYPLQALLLHEANPIYLAPDRDRLTTALAKIPFIADFATLPDDTTSFADLLLPTPTFLEGWEVCGAPPVFPYSLLGLSQPVVPARLGSKHPGDFLLAVAKRLGSPISDQLPFESFEQVVENWAQDIFSLQSGYPFGTQLEEVWDNLLERSGWWAPDYSTVDELWQQMKTKGGWWDPTYHHGEWGRVFQTPSGKFEFFSQLLWKHVLTEMKNNAGSMDLVSAERRCLPHFESSRASGSVVGDRAVPEDKSQFSFVLYPYEILPLNEARGADLPFLQQNLGQQVFERWGSWIEIHPEAARRLGIEDGSWVWVESARQKARLRARLFPGLRPEVVAIPIGLGHRTASRWSQGRGVNVNELLESVSSDPMKTLNGGSRWFSTRVRISRA